jgi:hypothetical protein
VFKVKTSHSLTGAQPFHISHQDHLTTAQARRYKSCRVVVCTFTRNPHFSSLNDRSLSLMRLWLPSQSLPALAASHTGRKISDQMMSNSLLHVDYYVLMSTVNNSSLIGQVEWCA